MRMSDWSSDVCSSDLLPLSELIGGAIQQGIPIAWTLASGDTQRDIAIAEEMIERRRHNRFKIKLGVRSPADDLRHIEKIIERVGDRAAVRVDINQDWDEDPAWGWVPRLAAAGVGLVETTVAHQQFL